MSGQIVNTSGDISYRTAGAVAARMLKVGKAAMFLEKFGQIDPQVENTSRTRRYRRYEPLPLAVAPLAEGVTPTGSRMTYTDIECTLEQYGDYVALTDVVMDTHEDKVLQQAVEACGQQIAETVETVRYYTVRAGSSVTYANSAASRATVNATVSRGDLRKIQRYMMKHRATQISKIIRASAKIGTDPVLPAFFAIGHTDLMPDLRNVSGFVDAAHYSESDNSIEGEVGKFEGIRFLLSQIYKPFESAGTSSTTWLSGGVAVSVAANADVYPILIVAKDSYAIVPLAGKTAVTPAVVNPKPAIGDELGQKGFVSWKMWQTAVILAQQWLHRYEVAVTANPS